MSDNGDLAHQLRRVLAQDGWVTQRDINKLFAGVLLGMLGEESEPLSRYDDNHVSVDVPRSFEGTD